MITFILFLKLATIYVLVQTKMIQNGNSLMFAFMLPSTSISYDKLFKHKKYDENVLS